MEHLSARVLVQAQLWVRAVFDAPCIRRASTPPAQRERVPVCRAAPDSAHRVPELEGHRELLHLPQELRTVRRADMRSVVAATIVTRNPKKVQ